MPGDDRETIQNDYDAFWKQAVDAFLPGLLQIAAPELHQAIDWNKPYESLNKEFQALLPTTDRKGRKFVDCLYRVTLLSGEIAQLFLHIEVQVKPDDEIERRILLYRIYIEEKFGGPVYNLLVLADNDPAVRPRVYEETVFDQTLLFEVPTLKLLDFRDRQDELENDKNPFALLILAWLGTTNSRPDRRRMEFKINLVKLLRLKGYARAQINQVFALLDWLVRLPESLILEFKHEVAHLDGDDGMPIVSPTLELCRKEGHEEGIREGIRDAIEGVLGARFGEVPATIRPRIEAIDDDNALRSLVELAATANDLAAFAAELRS